MPADPKKFFETLRQFRDRLVPSQQPQVPKQVQPQEAPERRVVTEPPPFPAGGWIPTPDAGTRLHVLQQAAHQHLLVRIFYKGKPYTIEPYSIKMVGGRTVDGKYTRAPPRVRKGELRPSRANVKAVQMLYGWCMDHLCQHHIGKPSERTHSFKFHEISAVQITDQKFSPRFPIEI